MFALIVLIFLNKRFKSDKEEIEDWVRRQGH